MRENLILQVEYRFDVVTRYLSKKYFQNYLTFLNYIRNEQDESYLITYKMLLIECPQQYDSIIDYPTLSNYERCYLINFMLKELKISKYIVKDIFYKIYYNPYTEQFPAEGILYHYIEKYLYENLHDELFKTKTLREGKVRILTKLFHKYLTSEEIDYIINEFPKAKFLSNTDVEDTYNLLFKRANEKQRERLTSNLLLNEMTK